MTTFADTNRGRQTVNSRPSDKRTKPTYHHHHHHRYHSNDNDNQQQQWQRQRQRTIIMIINLDNRQETRNKRGNGVCVCKHCKCRGQALSKQFHGRDAQEAEEQQQRGSVAEKSNRLAATRARHGAILPVLHAGQTDVIPHAVAGPHLQQAARQQPSLRVPNEVVSVAVQRLIRRYRLLNVHCDVVELCPQVLCAADDELVHGRHGTPQGGGGSHVGSGFERRSSKCASGRAADVWTGGRCLHE